MERIKRILSAVISAAIIFSVIMPVSAKDTESGVLSLLSQLNIMAGDPDGNMRLDDYVSRAEFTKIVVASSSYKNSVAANLAISPFPDVTYMHWAAPYVRVGVTNNIVSGYPDGTFKPENTVLYEEAITMLLRVLGYNDSDFGAAWPSGQIGLAENLDMTDDVECKAGDIMNRRQVAKLVYNTLKVKQKNQTSDLLSVFDTQIAEDVTLIACSKDDSSIPADEIFTTSGTYKIDDGFDISNIGLQGEAAIKDGNKLIAFVPDEEISASDEYIVYSVLDSEVLAYKGGVLSQVEIADDTAAYKGTSMMTFGSLKTQLKLGDRLRVRKTEAGEIDYVTYKEGNLLGPVTAAGGNWENIWNVQDGAVITRNGVGCAAVDIQNNDIVYYLRDLNMVLAYNNKVTGIYERAMPNRDTPVSIMLSGREYDLEGSIAFNKLYSGGEFEYGDTITLLLGKDNKVADVISPSASSDGVVGYLIETGSKEYSSGDIDTYTNYYIKVVQTDGSEYEYITDRDYTENRNSVVELSFSDGYARIHAVNGDSGVKGVFDWNSKRIGSTPVSSAVQILDVGTMDASQHSMYAKVYGQRIDGVELSDRAVIYADKNSAGEITGLILNNVTNDAYSYGIITKADVSEMGALYEYMVDNRHYSVSVSGKYSVSRGGAAQIFGSAERPDVMLGISAVKERITSISADRLVAGNVIYKISDKVQVYKRESATAWEYSMISLGDVISDMDNYNITAYYDKGSDIGGRIRIIVVSEKSE